MKPCGVVKSSHPALPISADINQQHRQRMPDDKAGSSGVAVRQPLEAAVEVAGEFVPSHVQSDSSSRAAVFPRCGCRICEASAGDSVSELKAEITVATAMVTANC